MLCLKAEALGREIYSASHGVILPVNLGSSIQKTMHRSGRNYQNSSFYDSGNGSAATSNFEDFMCSDRKKDTDSSEKMACYKFQLEKEVQILQKQLQEELDLHVALSNAIAQTTKAQKTPKNIPTEAQKLLATIAELEFTISKLEQELVILHVQISKERNELLNVSASSFSHEPTTTSVSSFMWEEHISSLRTLKFCGIPKANISEYGPSVLEAANISSSEKCMNKEVLDLCSSVYDRIELSSNIKQCRWKNLTPNHLPNKANRLSEEMVGCMRNIFLSLSKSPSSSVKSSLKFGNSSPFKPFQSPLTSFSDSSMSSSESHYSSNHELDIGSSFDLHKINGKMNGCNVCSYSMADELSTFSIGKEQLDYAADALKKFRFLVYELGKVNPAQLNNDEKIAFWINLYNTLIMHAYLAYGVPKTDIKMFSLMQKVSYTVGGQSFSAADIEFVILKMQPPPHRPQIALVLAIHNFRISEEHKIYSVDKMEPLVVYALSSGMYSSPAVRIFTSDNVQTELKESMRDYIQATVGISEKGKLLVPKLVHSFARNLVEDSLLIDWICQYLTPDQVTIVRDSSSQKKQRLLGVRSFSIVPFDTRFRYLFLPDKRS